MDPQYWRDLAEDYVAAYRKTFPAQPPPSRHTVLLCMSVAEHETMNGRAWPGTNNFGAVQLGPLKPQEYESWKAGQLHAGDFNAGRTGVLHIDTHPTPSGPQPYPVWFVAFPDSRVDGVAFFLKTLYRLSSAEADKPDASPASLAQAMYLHGYYEGAHADANRPPRTLPLSLGGTLNVQDYGGAIARCMSNIDAGLGDWGRDPTAQQVAQAALAQAALAPPPGADESDIPAAERPTQPELPPDPPEQS